MLRPSNKEFVEWTKSDSNVSRIRNALSTFPDLVKIKDHVSCNVSIFSFITFIYCWWNNNNLNIINQWNVCSTKSC